ncbi:hypothetical protein PENSPDRAFT_680376 [Peniophora sp. CONT]|nr:hypothetical protein PENSPDRAFT_680376 [Peniophora sp. CONT]
MQVPLPAADNDGRMDKDWEVLMRAACDEISPTSKRTQLWEDCLHVPFSAVHDVTTAIGDNPRNFRALLLKAFEKSPLPKPGDPALTLLYPFSTLVQLRRWDDIPSELWDILIACRIDDTFADVLVSDIVYKGDSEVEQIRLILLLHAISGVVRQALRSRVVAGSTTSGASTMDKPARRVLARLGEVLSKLWDHRDVLPDPHDAVGHRTAHELIAWYIAHSLEYIPFLALSSRRTEQQVCADVGLSADTLRLVMRMLLWCWKLSRNPLGVTPGFVIPSYAKCVLRVAALLSLAECSTMRAVICDAVTENMDFDQFFECLRLDLDRRAYDADKVAYTIAVLLLLSYAPRTELWPRISADFAGLVVEVGTKSGGYVKLSAVDSSQARLLALSFIRECVCEEHADGRSVAIEHTDFISFLSMTALNRPPAATAITDGKQSYVDCVVDLCIVTGVWYKKLAKQAGDPQLDARTRRALSERAARLRDSLLPSWYNVLRRNLDNFMPAGMDVTVERLEATRVAVAWRKLGNHLSIDEEVQRAAFQRDADKMRRCCDWRECKWYVVVPDTPVKMCKGCNRAYYCSVACQKSGWKDGKHKEVCKALKEKARQG